MARHLVAAGSLIDDDPEQALAHARAARDRASRIAAVREAVGVAAYHAGDYVEAARELRAYRRMTGDRGYRAVLADCERALGRPEVALRMVTDALADRPDAAERVELHLVEAGARQDLGEVAAARLLLEDALGGRPVPASLRPDAGLGTLRLASAYADLLRDEGEAELADEWLAAIAAADPENQVGALERLGVEFAEEDADDDEAGRLPAEPDVESLDQDIAVGGGAGIQAGNQAGIQADIEAESEADTEIDIEADAAAEVAELLGESSPDQASGPGSGGH